MSLMKKSSAAAGMSKEEVRIASKSKPSGEASNLSLISVLESSILSFDSSRDFLIPLERESRCL